MRFPPIGPYTTGDSSIAANRVKINQLIARYWPGGFQRTEILPVLVVLQHHFGWISPPALEIIKNQLSTTGISIGEIIGLARFYQFLQLTPTAAWQINTSSNITDLISGQKENWRRLLAYAQQNSTRLQVNRTSCTGLCDQGPALLLNGYPIACLTPATVDLIIQQIDANHPIEKWPKHLFTLNNPIVHSGPLLQHHINAGELTAKVKQTNGRDFLQQLQISGLQGRGGAAFSTYLKWQSCSESIEPQKYVICNADEGEPGTFKDRVLLKLKLENVIEGMRIGGTVIGARHGIIYLRKEYLFLVEHIEQTLQAQRQQKLLGEHFDIELFIGAGAYVCGEETALLESLEGKRGIPRIRPPFPTVNGYLGKPTVINNVETFCCICQIADIGGEAFRRLGFDSVPGSKIHSVSGDCEKPGIVELPLGASVNELLTMVGARDPALVQFGGPSGKLLKPDQFNTAIGGPDLNIGGSCMIFDNSRSVIDIYRNFMKFFAEESCGFCTPCRVGTQVINKKIKKLQQGKAGSNDLALIETTNQLLIHASHCGLGKAAGLCSQQILGDFADQTREVFAPEFIPDLVEANQSA